eukprot:6204384-Pleurochrysis_carterae.AAC.1
MHAGHTDAQRTCVLHASHMCGSHPQMYAVTRAQCYKPHGHGPHLRKENVHSAYMHISHE